MSCVSSRTNQPFLTGNNAFVKGSVVETQISQYSRIALNLPSGLFAAATTSGPDAATWHSSSTLHPALLSQNVEP